MNRPRLIRTLRIAWTTVVGVFSVLLTVLWMRSYSRLDWLRINQPAKSVASLNGRLRFNDVYNLNASPPRRAGSVIARRIATSDKNISLWTADRDTLVATGVGLSIPHWSIVLAAAILTALPWTPVRFSLRSILIAMTLLAALLGVAVCAS
jgi:hypothetical protein